MRIRPSLFALIATVLLCQCQGTKPDFAAAPVDQPARSMTPMVATANRSLNEETSVSDTRWKKALASMHQQARAEGKGLVVIGHNARPNRWALQSPTTR